MTQNVVCSSQNLLCEVISGLLSPVNNQCVSGTRSVAVEFAGAHSACTLRDIARKFNLRLYGEVLEHIFFSLRYQLAFVHVVWCVSPFACDVSYPSFLDVAQCNR